jgi:hypothetical protein
VNNILLNLGIKVLRYRYICKVLKITKATYGLGKIIVSTLLFTRGNIKINIYWGTWYEKVSKDIPAFHFNPCFVSIFSAQSNT